MKGCERKGKAIEQQFKIKIGALNTLKTSWSPQQLQVTRINGLKLQEDRCRLNIIKKQNNWWAIAQIGCRLIYPSH